MSIEKIEMKGDNYKATKELVGFPIENLPKSTRICFFYLTSNVSKEILTFLIAIRSQRSLVLLRK